jgi:large subunit ribosomal protein L30
MIAILQLRSLIKKSGVLKQKIKILNLGYVNNLTFLEESYCKNQKVLKDIERIVTYGPVSEETMKKVFEFSLKKVQSKVLEKARQVVGSQIQNLSDLCKVVYKDLSVLKKIGLKLRFKLHPPIGGLKSNLKFYKTGGDLGIRPNMDGLLNRMCL